MLGSADYYGCGLCCILSQMRENRPPPPRHEQALRLDHIVPPGLNAGQEVPNYSAESAFDIRLDGTILKR